MICDAVKADGTQCIHPSLTGTKYCGHHESNRLFRRKHNLYLNECIKELKITNEELKNNVELLNIKVNYLEQNMPSKLIQACFVLFYVFSFWPNSVFFISDKMSEYIFLLLAS